LATTLTMIILARLGAHSEGGNIGDAGVPKRICSTS